MQSNDYVDHFRMLLECFTTQKGDRIPPYVVNNLRKALDGVPRQNITVSMVRRALLDSDKS